MAIRSLGEVIVIKTRKDIIHPIRRLVRKHCASFHSASKCYACPGDQPTCSYFREDGKYPEYLKEGKVRCIYFESHVLPNDPKLEAVYFGRHPSTDEITGSCERCKKTFVKSNNRQEYCIDCGPIVTRQNARERQRRIRQEKKHRSVTY